MATLRCPACSLDVQVAEAEGARCPNCDGLLIAPESSAAPRPLLELTYRKTGARLAIDAAPAELGREAFGAEVLGTIPQVSRRHCRIELRGDAYFARDLESMHGTFVEVAGERRSCGGEGIGLRDGTRLWLGQEEFLVRLRASAPVEAGQDVTSVGPPTHRADAPLKRFCPDCGCEVEPSAITCPRSHFLG